MPVMKRQLWQCFNAKANKQNIICSAGHKLAPSTWVGGLQLYNAKVGKPLELSVCQNCPDFDCMGERLEKDERGWN